MALLKKLALFMLVGASLGMVVATLAAPGFLSWYNAPGAGGAMCNCVDLVQNTVGQVIRIQLGGGLAGLVVFLLVGIVVHRWQRRRQQAKQAAAGTPPVPDKPAAPAGQDAQAVSAGTTKSGP